MRWQLWLGLSVALLPCTLATVRGCIRVSRKVASKGDGSTPESCMSCDPANPVCPEGCQKLVHKFYDACEGVCLPDGYYFDPPQTLGGCWKKVKHDIEIAVNRCGCSSATRIQHSAITAAAAIAVASLLVHVLRFE